MGSAFGGFQIPHKIGKSITVGTVVGVREQSYSEAESKRGSLISPSMCLLGTNWVLKELHDSLPRVMMSKI